MSNDNANRDYLSPYIQKINEEIIRDLRNFRDGEAIKKSRFKECVNALPSIQEPSFENVRFQSDLLNIVYDLKDELKDDSYIVTLAKKILERGRVATSDNSASQNERTVVKDEDFETVLRFLFDEYAPNDNVKSLCLFKHSSDKSVALIETEETIKTPSKPDTVKLTYWFLCCNTSDELQTLQDSLGDKLLLNEERGLKTDPALFAIILIKASAEWLASNQEGQKRKQRLKNFLDSLRGENLQKTWEAGTTLVHAVTQEVTNTKNKLDRCIRECESVLPNGTSREHAAVIYLNFLEAFAVQDSHTLYLSEEQRKFLAGRKRRYFEPFFSKKLITDARIYRKIFMDRQLDTYLRDKWPKFLSFDDVLKFLPSDDPRSFLKEISKISKEAEKMLKDESQQHSQQFNLFQICKNEGEIEDLRAIIFQDTTQTADSRKEYLLKFVGLCRDYVNAGKASSDQNEYFHRLQYEMIVNARGLVIDFARDKQLLLFRSRHKCAHFVENPLTTEDVFAFVFDLYGFELADQVTRTLIKDGNDIQRELQRNIDETNNNFAGVSQWLQEKHTQFYSALQFVCDNIDSYIRFLAPLLVHEHYEVRDRYVRKNEIIKAGLFKTFARGMNSTDKHTCARRLCEVFPRQTDAVAYVDRHESADVENELKNDIKDSVDLVMKTMNGNFQPDDINSKSVIRFYESLTASNHSSFPYPKTKTILGITLEEVIRDVLQIAVGLVTGLKDFVMKGDDLFSDERFTEQLHNMLLQNCVTGDSENFFYKYPCITIVNKPHSDLSPVMRALATIKQQQDNAELAAFRSEKDQVKMQQKHEVFVDLFAKLAPFLSKKDQAELQNGRKLERFLRPVFSEERFKYLCKPLLRSLHAEEGAHPATGQQNEIVKLMRKSVDPIHLLELAFYEIGAGNIKAAERVMATIGRIDSLNARNHTRHGGKWTIFIASMLRNRNELPFAALLQPQTSAQTSNGEYDVQKMAAMMAMMATHGCTLAQCYFTEKEENDKCAMCLKQWRRIWLLVQHNRGVLEYNLCTRFLETNIFDTWHREPRKDTSWSDSAKQILGLPTSTAPQQSTQRNLKQKHQHDRIGHAYRGLDINDKLFKCKLTARRAARRFASSYSEEGVKASNNLDKLYYYAKAVEVLTILMCNRDLYGDLASDRGEVVERLKRAMKQAEIVMADMARQRGSCGEA